MKNRCMPSLATRSLAIALVCALGAALPEPALSASTDWVETEGGRIRLSALAPSEDGGIRAVLDVELLPGWKTYWRDPGEAGVPPSLVIDRSDNISSAQIHFPVPERITDTYSTWAGYDYPVLFPITFRQETPGKASTLEADIFLGICQDICIPFQTSFTLEIDPDTPANAFEQRLVKRAFGSLPDRPDNVFRVTGQQISDDGNTLTLSVATPKADEKAELFVTGPPGWRLDTPRIVSRDGKIVTFRVDVSGKPNGETLKGRSVSLLVKASERAMETELVLPD
jgi:DsbC/DsbD-like thiol-disulfide interchange protein